MANVQKTMTGLIKVLFKRLSGVGFLAKRDIRKFIFLAVAGINLPLAGLLIFLIFQHFPYGGLYIVTTVTLSVLISATITILIIKEILEPLVIAKDALEVYLQKRQLVSLPTTYANEAAVLFQNVQHTLETLDKTLAEKKELVTLLSHDVRAPLGQVIGMCNLILGTDDRNEVTEYCNMLIVEMQNQLNFLEEVVKMNRLDSIDIAFEERERVAVTELVDRAMHSLNVQTIEKNISWEFDIQGDLMVNVNRHLFSQAIQNVISNAIKFSYEKSVISIRSHAESNHKIIEIRDQGLGFKPEESGRIFTRFTRHGKSGTRGEKSSGLGLYLTKNIVERHQGRIEAFSDGPGQGALFRFTLND